MKHLALIITFLAVFTSCSKDIEEATTTADYYGKWTLVKMSGSMINSVTTGTAMEWQESYLFKNDGTFEKSRMRNTVETKAVGTYTAIDYQDGKYLELTYSNDSEIIGSCYGNLTESLYFSAANTLSSTWRACDGPGLEYQKADSNFN
ncbi:hypothetical protein SAMN05443549_1123 [Flavobacterium fluvii]|uniref:Lipocalin-like domain-containing protein n=1 Tax=Flavobacterium fluvii TaxID=468056 RepID=A0A1M5PP39_9FLAO|nr:hypothetical protein [Flavobacterium fluvii]SHH03013.1 hypothetical protein SAMN05443549_1123 [Flavobacterium fluvii]